MISKAQYKVLFVLISAVYATGMFVTLFENDSAQFAVMAMRMLQENDFLSLFKGPEEYLDKPHLHYWLAAISFKIFGLHDWAYRIPGIMATFLAAYSCFGLGRLLYSVQVGRLAALIFMTAQTIVLAAIDVRTDGVLTGFVALAIWQLASFLEKENLKNLLAGAVAMGLAFSTKGQIAVLVIGLPLLCHTIYRNKWKVLASWKILLAVAVFFLTISPVLYAYYLQFDLHPEKIIRGRGNRSGVFFILWEQSFERLSGEGIGKNSSDYFFFFHTFLWVFLPWTVLAVLAYISRSRKLIKVNFKQTKDLEVLTLGGITMVFLIISFAQFKLPHYLNITIPLFAVLTASYVYELIHSKNERLKKGILGFQQFIFLLVIVFAVLVVVVVFPLASFWSYTAYLILGILLVLFIFRKKVFFKRLVYVSAGSALLLNTVLNTHFYPSLLKYQAGSEMARIVAANNIPVDRIYKIGERYSWALDFYNQKPVKISATENLKVQGDYWVYATDEELAILKNEGLFWEESYTVKQFRITRLQAKFLNPASRLEVLNRMHLVHLRF
ncbi:ArnT family glycosyltransferase [Eudoraea chungangensis]|uniref:ArnT family glycosyltransferase n=1 Tax=Eudoraea chungangensis TaxID=1481905 RepID=UPI0023EAD706|nr:glycosyltransferase family 39 protein [Eudoraea chungangensis]